MESKQNWIWTFLFSWGNTINTSYCLPCLEAAKEASAVGWAEPLPVPALLLLASGHVQAGMINISQQTPQNRPCNYRYSRENFNLRMLVCFRKCYLSFELCWFPQAAVSCCASLIPGESTYNRELFLLWFQLWNDLVHRLKHTTIFTTCNFIN